MESIKIKISSKLRDILVKNDIDPFTGYRPAYDGESVGLDLFYAGDKTLTIEGRYDRTFGKTDKVLIPTGVHMALPKSYVCFIKDRGSISKTNVVRRAGVVDPGYTDELFVNLATLDGKPCIIKPGGKLPVQLVVVKAETNYEVVSDEEYDALVASAKRKENKVGSSD